MESLQIIFYVLVSLSLMLPIYCFTKRFYIKRRMFSHKQILMLILILANIVILAQTIIKRDLESITYRSLYHTVFSIQQEYFTYLMYYFSIKVVQSQNSIIRLKVFIYGMSIFYVFIALESILIGINLCIDFNILMATGILIQMTFLKVSNQLRFRITFVNDHQYSMIQQKIQGLICLTTICFMSGIVMFMRNMMILLFHCSFGEYTYLVEAVTIFLVDFLPTAASVYILLPKNKQKSFSSQSVSTQSVYLKIGNHTQTPSVLSNSGH